MLFKLIFRVRERGEHRCEAETWISVLSARPEQESNLQPLVHGCRSHQPSPLPGAGIASLDTRVPGSRAPATSRVLCSEQAVLPPRGAAPVGAQQRTVLSVWGGGMGKGGRGRGRGCRAPCPCGCPARDVWVEQERSPRGCHGHSCTEGPASELAQTRSRVGKGQFAAGGLGASF